MLTMGKKGSPIQFVLGNPNPRLKGLQLGSPKLRQKQTPIPELEMLHADRCARHRYHWNVFQTICIPRTMVKRYCTANKLKRLAIKPITERGGEKEAQTSEGKERQRVLNEIRERLKVNGRKKGKKALKLKQQQG